MTKQQADENKEESLPDGFSKPGSKSEKEAAPSNGESKPEQPDKERGARIVKLATDLYDAFKGVEFDRDSFIELGESVKANVTFNKVHPAVQRRIMLIAKKIHKID